MVKSGKEAKIEMEWKDASTDSRYLKMIVHRMNLAGMADSDFHLMNN